MELAEIDLRYLFMRSQVYPSSLPGLKAARASGHNTMW